MEFRKLIGYRIWGIPAGLLARYLWGLLSLFALLMIFTAAVGHGIRLKYEVMVFFGDCALIVAPVFLLPRRWRWTAVIPVALLALYLTASEIYYRYWGDFLPLTSIFTSASWNGFVAGSIPGMFSLTDGVILLIPVVYGFVVRMLGKAEAGGSAGKPDASFRRRGVAFFVSVVFWALTFACGLLQHRGYLRSIDADSSPGAVVASRLRSSSSLYGNWQSGLPIYFYLEIKNLFDRGSRLQLTEEERAFVDRVLRVRKREELTFTPPINRSKNLIFIIVESLNADIVGKKYAGRSVTPLLDSLLRMPGTVPPLNIKAQIGAGGSSDGQLIYNTGLLPVYHGCTAQLYASSSTFPSLAKTLGKKAAREYIVEEGRVWFHTATSKAYGYDRLNDAARLDSLGIEPADLGGDRAVFTMALTELPALPQPFLAEIVTLSMHFPYEDPGVPRQEWIEALTGIGTSERNYLQMTSYFDRELGRFLRGLKEKGLYDNSVIVIASDHDQLYRDVTDVASSQNVSPIVFMALNTGMTERIVRPAWQMDVYPTVLDLMGYDGDGYRGIGHSLMAAGGETDSVSVEDCRRASDLIIRSDFFGSGVGGF